MIREIFHVGVTIPEIDQSLRIYRDGVGMSLLNDASREGEWIERITGLPGFRGRIVYLTTDSHNRVEFIHIAHPKIHPLEPSEHPFLGVSHVGLHVKNVSDLMERLAGLGTWPNMSVRRSVKITGPIWEDNDGLRWEIFDSRTDSVGQEMKRPVEIEHIGMLVSDMRRSKSFYTEQLGLELKEEGKIWINGWKGKAGEDEIYGAFARLSSPVGQILELRQLQNISAKPTNRKSIDWFGFTHVAFLSKNAREMYNKLKTAGVETISEPQELQAGPARGGFAFYFYDPDRITLEIVELPQ